MVADVTKDNKSCKSLILNRIDSVTDHTQDVKPRQDRLRQVDLHMRVSYTTSNTLNCYTST